MDQFSGIRAKTRRNPEAAAATPSPAPTRTTARRSSAALALGGRLVVLSSLLMAGIPPAAASDPHAAAPAPAPAAAAPPPPPPPPEPRKPPPDVKPPIAGTIAKPTPKARLRWLSDPGTGLALGGYDPLVYFLDDRAGLGVAAHELDWGGTTWRFRNEGNLAAFRAAPETYAPAFGGRCAFAVARGYPTEGSPLHHLVWRGQLLLFADATSRVAFLADPDRLLAEARRRWPAILDQMP